MYQKQMNTRTISIILLSLLCWFPTSLLGATAHEVTVESRIHRITGLLDGAAVQMTVSRKQIGANFLGMGLALAGAGGIVLASTNDDSWNAYGKVGLTIGTSLAVGGGIIMLLSSPYERPASSLLPKIEERSDADRLAAYEKAFRQLAEEERQARRSGAWLGLGLGAISVSAAALLSNFSNDTRRLLVTLGTVWVGAGAVSFFTKGPYESQFETYQTWRTGNLSAESTPGFKFGVVPQVRGGSLCAILSFL